MPTTVAESKVVKWGNSQGVRIPRSMCDAVGIGVGDTLHLMVEGHTIVISAVQDRPRYKRRGNRTIEEVFAGYEGPPMGDEWIHGRVGAEVLDD
ncbi:MAG: AbrB/MazE/SpoVT family DNA-binding domain-containing protein [Atopobiaceae bacterium]|nr:AbrB/MazE/SpoVT family DNA-binding domain-containing protein [Atopobiaceae bacterium]